MTSLAARLKTRGAAAMALSLAIVAALVAGPALPANAIGIDGPPYFSASYPDDTTVRLFWEQVNYPMEGYYTDGYEVSYTNGAGTDIDRRFLTEQLESDGVIGFYLNLDDVGAGSTVVKVRATFSPDGASEWSQLTVNRELAALAATADELAASYEGRYTLSSATALATAIASARALVSAGSSDTTAIAAASAALTTAADNMVNYAEFAYLVDAAFGWDVSGFTPGSRARYDAAFNAAVQLLVSAQDDATAVITQSDFDAATGALNNAYYSGSSIPAEFAALLAEADAFVAAPDGYTAYSVTSVAAASAAARAAIAAEQANDETLSAAVAQLSTALDARLERPESLRSAFAAYAALTGPATDVTINSRKAMSAANAAAIALDASAGATAESLTAAASALSGAIAALVDLSTLRVASIASGTTGLTSTAYTTTTWNYLVAVTASSSMLLASTAPTTAQQVAQQVADQKSARASLATPTAATVAPSGQSFVAPGIYVSVLDGQINVTNPAGTVNYIAGQFGYTASFTQPPVLVPSNPGIQFTPPPSFSSVPAAPTGSNNIDCVVRAERVAAGATANADTEPIKKTFCNATRVDGLTPVGAATTSAADAVASDYVVKEAFPATRPVDGKLDVTFTLPAGVNSVDLYFQYVYNGEYFETNTVVQKTALAAEATPAATSATAAAAATALAQTGTDMGGLVGSAALLLLVGGALTVLRSRRRVTQP